MDFAFVGSEPEWRLWEPWFSPASPHRVVVVLRDPPHAGPTYGPPSVRTVTYFEDLLAAPGVQAFFLGGPVAERARRLRLAVQTGTRCVCLLPIGRRALAYHELATIADEAGTVLVPVIAARLHPAWRAFLAELPALGTPRRVRVERTGDGPVGPELVAGPYAEAVDLLRAVVGPISDITAAGDVARGRLIVQHGTRAGGSAEILLETASEGRVPDADSAAGAFAQPTQTGRWSVRVEAEHGTARLEFPDGLLGIGLVTMPGSDGAATKQIAAPPGGASLDELLEPPRADDRVPRWEDAVEAGELADCALESIERRRTVDVVAEDRGELARFKGTMTSCGCALVWMSLLALIVAAAGHGLGVPGVAWLLRGSIVLMVLFLLLQALRWVVPSGR